VYPTVAAPYVEIAASSLLVVYTVVAGGVVLASPCAATAWTDWARDSSDLCVFSCR